MLYGKRGLDYRIYGGLSFYQRKEIKDVLSYLRIIINPSDEEALKRIINFPVRGIGQTTIDRLIISANEYNISIFEVLRNLNNLTVNINVGIKNKLQNFATMIESFQVMSKTTNAFDLTEHVCKVSGLIKEFKKDGTPEGISRMENIEELLNGIKDFVEGQQEIADSTGSLAEFLEDVALATDLDNEEGEESDKVALMTIHLAKGLEFKYVYVVGLEENLFPSAMSMNTRNELEEERRLFYVALTRAEKKAYLTYALSRYRWGKLVDSEPSRFIEEIDEQYLDIVTPKEERRFNPMLSADIFGDVDPNIIRYKKPAYLKAKPKTNESFKITAPKNLKKVSETKNNTNLFDNKLIVGDVVNHQRFGKGNVLNIEGKAADLKAEIKFENGGVKKLLLRFAKLEIIS
jgi:DNA helicase-2/ATP-dependent DNA helicase PcrA